jgi:purine catabolism regulator
MSQALSKNPEYARELLRTLEVFVENDSQLNETAKKLYIHRNTATYRMEKMSELLQLDMKKRMNELLRLKLAFQFRHLLGGELAVGERPSVV